MLSVVFAIQGAKCAALAAVSMVGDCGWKMWVVAEYRVGWVGVVVQEKEVQLKKKMY